MAFENKQSTIISMVLSSGILVNKDVTSKLAMARLSELKSRLNNSCTKEKESRTMKALEQIGLRMGTKNLAIL
jgi:hypothetical protein